MSPSPVDPRGNPLRVLYLSHGYPPALGGIQRQLGLVCPRLVAAGIDVTVVARSGDAATGSEVVEGVRVQRVAAGERGALASLRFLAGVARFVARQPQPPHVVHSHEIFSTTTAALRVKRDCGAAIVAEPHSSGIHGEVDRLRAKLLGDRRWHQVARRVDRFVAIDGAIRGELEAAGVDPGIIVDLTNAVDVQAHAPADTARRCELRHQLGLPDASPVVVFAGRLEPVKGVGDLLGAWRHVRSQLQTASLVVLGDGSLRRAVSAAADEDLVRAPGAVERVEDYFAAADLFVLPSRAEGVSMALLEAMASGLACVATDVGGSAAVLGAGRYGVLCAAGDEAALARELLRLLKAPEARRELGRAARERVARDFAVDDKVARLVALYRELAQRSSDTLTS